MRLDGIAILNYLSFESFEWTNLDSNVNLLVGPNGVGKTNLFHALRMAINGASTFHQPFLLPNENMHHGSQKNRMEFALDIEFTEEEEKQLLLVFLRAALYEAIKLATSGLTSAPHNAALATFICQHLALKDIEWLFSGRLVVYYERGRQQWSSYYEARAGKNAFHLHIEGGNTGSSLSGEQSNFVTEQLVQQWNEIGATEQVKVRPQLLRPFPNGGEGIFLEVHSPQGFDLDTHQAFEEVASIVWDNNRSYGPQTIFEWLMSRSFVFTDNIRGGLKQAFTLEEFRNEPIDLSNGELLAQALFRWKNGQSQGERDTYASIQETFRNLTEKELDVRLSLPPPRGNLRTSKTQNADLLLEISTIRDRRDIPLEYSGAGLMEALFLSTLLASGTGRVLCLDEPALNIHPTMQSSLLKEIQSAKQQQAHNQFFLVTHSPFLVPPEIITKVSRFYWQKGRTISARLNAAQLDDQQMGALEKELRRSSDVRGMLFSSAIILFEGETELGALPVWFEKQFGYSLESRVVALHSAGGELGFQTYVRFLNQFKIPWTIVCDGPIIANDGRAGLAHQLTKAGVEKVPELQAFSFEKRCQELKPFGVFTLASDEQGEFEALQVIQEHQEEAKRLFGRSKVRQGRYIAETYDCPDVVKDILKQLAEYLKLEKAARK